MGRMIYTQATLLEAHGLGKVALNLLPRKALRDFEYKGFQFMKGTAFLADLNSSYHREEFGVERDSWEFRPERLIWKEDGIKFKGLAMKVMPFDVGKRICPGSRLAEVSAFFFVVAIVRRFKLGVVPGEDPPSKEMQISFTSRPAPFRFCISKRFGLGTFGLQ
jgi:cytochrome P450